MTKPYFKFLESSHHVKKLIDPLYSARFEERAWIVPTLPSHFPGTRNRMLRRAGIFLAEAITPLTQIEGAVRDANGQFVQLNRAPQQRRAEPGAWNHQLQQEILQRKAVEESFKKSEQHYNRLLEQSRHVQEQFRQMVRQLLSAQEEERKMISRDLHDEIAQTLSVVNARLASLKSEATVKNKGLQREISSMQRQVGKSMDILHRFARELRPTVLDDLGLIPTLHTFVKRFARRTGVRVHLTAYAAVERLDMAIRTVLFRVAQEALMNVARHAKANRVEVSIQKSDAHVCIRIKDDGKSFNVKRVLRNGGNRLGLLGLRERVEMIGGRFDIESASGKGTLIEARIPLGNICPRRGISPTNPALEYP